MIVLLVKLGISWQLCVRCSYRKAISGSCAVRSEWCYQQACALADVWVPETKSWRAIASAASKVGNMQVDQRCVATFYGLAQEMPPMLQTRDGAACVIVR